MDEFWRHLDADPKTCHGQLRFRGTRVMVYQVLEALAQGATEAEILAAYPTLTQQHLRAAMAYGAHVAKQETFIPLAAGDKP